MSAKVSACQVESSNSAADLADSFAAGSASHPSSASAHRRMCLLLPGPKPCLRQILSNSLPPQQLPKARLHAHQDESPNVVKTFENTLAAWRLSVQPYRLSGAMNP
jgi:hypothetical protein